MKNAKASEIMNQIRLAIIAEMGKAADCFVVTDLNDDPNYKSFVIGFLAYDYFKVGIDYDKGRISLFISSGELKIWILPLRTWWEKMDLEKWVKEFDENLRLRIPDKYLESKVWEIS